MKKGMGNHAFFWYNQNNEHMETYEKEVCYE